MSRRSMRGSFGWTSAVLAWSAASFAADPTHDPLTIVQTSPDPSTHSYFVGTDIMIGVMEAVLAGLAGSLGQLTVYQGIGSSCAQRQMEGNPTVGEPVCLPADSNGGAELNAGCQEIAAMSRQMNSSICEDETLSGTNAWAESLAICSDNLVIITDNRAHAQFADGPALCPVGAPPGTGVSSANEPFDPYTVNASYAGAGKLRNAGTLPGIGPGGSPYMIGAGGLAGWKDVLRLVYTGCRNDQGSCAAVPRTARCTGGATNPTRQAVIDRWDFLVESGAVAGDLAGDCNGATANACAAGLRAAYRRDDSSGTTAVFLSLLSLGSSLGFRTTLTSGVPAAITAISETNMFCDGGDNEDWLPGATAAPAKGDPISKPCKPEDDLCNCNGQMGVVRAVRSPLTGAGITNEVNYPPRQCTRGSFAYVPWISTSLNVCPDGTKPTAGHCKLPYFNDTSTTPPTRRFNCINDAGSRPITATACDGRAYNFVMRDDAGTVRFRSGNLPQGALMRHNVRVLDTVLPVPGGPWTAATPAACEELDASKQLGCLVANTTCTIGFAQRDGITTEPFDNLHEPLRLNGFAPTDVAITTPGQYPFVWDLFMSAIGGFENITLDCAARGGSAEYCADEVAIANEFFNMTPNVQSACRASGYVPKVESTCVGTQAVSGCGAPTDQARDACQPQ
jgi:hypothetical protein